MDAKRPRFYRRKNFFFVENVVPSNPCKASEVNRKKTFKPRVTAFFQLIEQSGRNDCNAIFQEFCNTFKQDMVSLYAVRIAIEKFMELLYRSNYDDDDFISKVLHAKLTIDSWCRDNSGSSYQKLQCPLDSKEVVSELLQDLQLNRHGNIMECPCEFLSEVTYEVMREGKYDYVKFLVKYGLNEFPPRFVKDVKALIDSFVGTVYSYFESWPEALREENIDFSLHMEVNEANGDIVNYKTNNKDKKTCMIMYTAMLSMILVDLADETKELYFQYSHPKVSRALIEEVKCVNLIMETLPEPFPSFEDIENLFILMCVSPMDDSRLKEVCVAFRETFPQCKELPNPRSLKDLSRCKIRDSLRKNESLPKQLAELGIPSNLKDFILFNEKKRW